MNIEQVKLSELTPYSGNAKKHDERQIKNVMQSIKEFGVVQPLVCDKDNVLIIGHCRLIACKRLKMRTVPVVRIENLSDEQVNKLRLLDNKLNESEWDMDLLADQVPDLDWTDFDIDWGLPEEPKDEYEIVEDEIPDEVEERCKLGDVWQLGDHRLICGDCTDPDVIGKVMSGEQAPLAFTSPPYSDIRDYNGDKDLSVSNIINFIEAIKKYAEYIAVNLGIQRKNGEIVQYWDAYIDKAKKSGLKFLAWNVWDKLMCGSIGQQKAFVPIRHEWIFVFGKKEKELNLTWEKKKSSIYANGGKRKVRQKDGTTKFSTRGVTSNAFKKMESVVKIPEKDSLDSVTEQFSETGKIRAKHPATFPVHLPAEYIIAFTDEGEAVLEPFGGSGTTLIACEQLHRKCRIVELDEHYCDVIIERWEQFTGGTAVKI